MKASASQNASMPQMNQSLIKVLHYYYQHSFKHYTRDILSYTLFLIISLMILHKFSSIDSPSPTPAPKILHPLPDNADIKPTLSQPEWKRYIVSRGETFTQVLKKAGLSTETWQEILALGENVRCITQVYPEQIIDIDSRAGQLMGLTHALSPVRTLYILREKNGMLTSFMHEKTLENRVAFASAAIENSLFLSAKRANLDENITKQLTDVFASVIDFSHEKHPNDSFKVLYEEQFVEGEKISTGDVLAVELNINGDIHRAIRHISPEGQISYYSPNGLNLKRTFLSTPVNFSRISSYFNPQRKHPILHKIRAHKGVDYVAPAGTPVKAVGEGRVSFQGRKGGYGKTVILEHDLKRSTVYAHLSGFSKNLKPGKRVSQGEVIGYVGSTGLATGPHLHYEFRINGKHYDPLTLPTPRFNPIPPEERPTFLQKATHLVSLFEYHDKIMMASNEY